MHDVLSFNLNSYESKIFDFPFLLFFIPTYLSGFNDLNMQSFGLIWLNFCKLLVCTLHEGINPLAPFLLLQSHLISYSRIIVYIYILTIFLIFRFCPGIWFIFSKHSLFVGINCFFFTLFFYSFPLEEGKELGRQNGRRGRELIDLYLFFQIFCLYISFLIYIYILVLINFFV